MKFCQYCGNQLNDAALFCDKCGQKVGDSSKQNDNQPIKEGKVYKCPFCGEILPSNVDKCPTCGNEIRGREVVSSLKELTDKLEQTDDDAKKVSLIKTFPIPNSREDIVDFMLLASSNFDAKHYVSYKRQDTVDSAWLTKIEQCYQKAQLLFSSKADLLTIENIYQEVQKKIKGTSKTKLILILVGVALIIVGAVLTFVSVSIKPDDTTESSLSDPYMILFFASLVVCAVGVVLTVLGAKKKNTVKEIEEAKALKQEKDRQKAQLKIEKERNKRR